MKNEPTEREDVHRSDGKKESMLLGRLGRLAAYTTPAMKALLYYGEDKLRNGLSPPP